MPAIPVKVKHHISALSSWYDVTSRGFLTCNILDIAHPQWDRAFRNGDLDGRTLHANVCANFNSIALL